MEIGYWAWALALATGEAARYATATGLGKIRDRVQALAGRLRAGLSAPHCVRVLDRGRELCGIVSAWIDDPDPAELVAALRERGINTSAQIRVYAVIDYDEMVKIFCSIRWLWCDGFTFAHSKIMYVIFSQAFFEIYVSTGTNTTNTNRHFLRTDTF